MWKIVNSSDVDVPIVLLLNGNSDGSQQGCDSNVITFLLIWNSDGSHQCCNDVAIIVPLMWNSDCSHQCGNSDVANTVPL